MDNKKEKLSVIFDMDGVIFDTENMIFRIWGTVAGEYHLNGIEEVIKLCIGTNAEATKKIVLEHMGSDFDYDGYKKIVSEKFHAECDRNGMPVKKGVYEILDYLKSVGAHIGMASSTRLAIVEKELDEAGLSDYFDVVCGGDQLKRSKPEPDIYLLAAKKLGVVPHDIFAVEDSYNGIRSAYAAEMRPIMVPDMLEPDDEMKAKSVAVLKDLCEVKRYLMDNNST